MRHTFATALSFAAVCVALARCAFDFPGADAGFACTDDSSCAPGWLCLAGRCAREGTPPRDSGNGGGAGGGTASTFHAALRFTSQPVPVQTGACSDSVTYALFDDAGAQVTAPADVTVTVSAPGLSVFGDIGCSSPLTAAPIRSLGSFNFTGANAGMFDVTLSGEGLDPATQQQTVVAVGTPRLLITSAAPAPALAGTCVGPINVELRDGNGAPLPAPDGGLTLVLTSQPGGLRFSPGPGCSPGPVTVAPRATATSFSVISETGLDYLVTVSIPGFNAATVAVPLRALVRTGTCNLAANEHIKTCAVTPPVLDTTRTFLVYQSSPTAHDPSQASVACVLGNAGAVTCQRWTDGGTAGVTWHTAELAGARVDRYDYGCASDGGDFVTIPLGQTVPLARQFLLSAAGNSGADLSGNDLFTVTPSPTQLLLHWSNGCNVRRGQLQVVQVPGFNTARAGGALMAELTADAGGLPAPDGGAFTLAMWRINSPGNGENRVCDRMLRAEVAGPNAVRVSRAAGNAAPECTEYDVDEWAVERVDVGRRGTVRELVVTLDAGVSSLRRTIPAVDVTRTIVFASGQSGGVGQSAGEGFYAADAGGFLGEAAVTLKLNSATEVQLDRAGSRAAAVVTVYVLELEP